MSLQADNAACLYFERPQTSRYQFPADLRATSLVIEVRKMGYHTVPISGSHCNNAFGSCRVQKAPEILSFDFFPDLPEEIRRMIWSLARPNRIITVDVDVFDGGKPYLSGAKPVALLQVCQESRNEALRSYDRFETDPFVFRRCQNAFGYRRPTSYFIDFSCDTIFFDQIWSLPHVLYELRELLVRTQHLAILYRHHWEWKIIRQPKSLLHSLKNLLFIGYQVSAVHRLGCGRSSSTEFIDLDVDPFLDSMFPGVFRAMNQGPQPHLWVSLAGISSSGMKELHAPILPASVMGPQKAHFSEILSHLALVPDELT
jgi:hypothetical protein